MIYNTRLHSFILIWEIKLISDQAIYKENFKEGIKYFIHCVFLCFINIYSKDIHQFDPEFRLCYCSKMVHLIKLLSKKKCFPDNDANINNLISGFVNSQSWWINFIPEMVMYTYIIFWKF